MGSLKTIVFIHGLHENSHVWAAWKVFFQELGYICYAPSYPYHEGRPSELRSNPSAKLATVRLNQVLLHYQDYIDHLKIPKPTFIGHSMGGLIVQKLIENQSGCLGVCIGSAPPKGIFCFKWSFIKSNIGTVNPLMRNSLYLGTKQWFHYAICNTLTRQESDRIYENTVVPESRNIARSSQVEDGKVDFKKPHKPLLFIAGEKDRITPPSLNRANANAYLEKGSVTDFKVFEGRSHGICIQSGWRDVAQFVEHWILKNTTSFDRLH